MTTRLWDTLIAKGANEVIPETHEASLTLLSHILLMLDYPNRMIHSTIDKARRDRYQKMKGFYHGQRMRFLDKESGAGEIIHAVSLPTSAFACDKTLGSLELPLEVQVLEIHRKSQVIAAKDNDTLTLQPGDIVILRRLVDGLDPVESSLLRG